MSSETTVQQRSMEEVNLPWLRNILSADLRYGQHATLPDKSSIKPRVADKRADRWIVEVHDAQSGRDIKIEVLNDRPMFAAWVRKATGYDHTPGKIATFEKYVDGKKVKVRNPKPKEEYEISSPLITALQVQIDPTNRAVMSPTQAWEKLRSRLFT